MVLTPYANFYYHGSPLVAVLLYPAASSYLLIGLFLNLHAVLFLAYMNLLMFQTTRIIYSFRYSMIISSAVLLMAQPPLRGSICMTAFLLIYLDGCWNVIHLFICSSFYAFHQTSSGFDCYAPCFPAVSFTYASSIVPLINVCYMQNIRSSSPTQPASATTGSTTRSAILFFMFLSIFER